MESIIRSRRHQPEPDRAEERKVEMAIRQLERAELYVLSAIDLELTAWEHRRALHDLRCEVLAVCDLLRQPKRIR